MWVFGFVSCLFSLGKTDSPFAERTIILVLFCSWCGCWCCCCRSSCYHALRPTLMKASQISRKCHVFVYTTIAIVKSPFYFSGYIVSTRMILQKIIYNNLKSYGSKYTCTLYNVHTLSAAIHKCNVYIFTKHGIWSNLQPFN